jgi:hypothetical protein
MARLSRFEDYRFVGNRDTQVVYDLDDADAEVTEQLEDAARRNRVTVFSPDALAEARNRGYRPSSGGAAPIDTD